MTRVIPLDGLRGAAALSVVAAHYFGEVAHGTTALSFGWLGVGVFFALSGYLIGSIILDGEGKPGFFAAFYFRRSVRIIPVYLITVLATLAALEVFRGAPWAVPAFGLPVYLTFTQNFAVAFHGPGNLWLLPTWTLAVEEQFYLLLPLLIVIAPRRLLIGILIGLVLSSLAFRLDVVGVNKMAASSLLPARADVLLSGVIAAWLQRRLDLSRRLLTLRLIPLAAACAVIVVSLIDRDRLFTVVGPLLVGVGAASFILALVHGAPEGKRFNGPTMVFFGRISYALYLFHQPVSGLLHGVLLGGQPDVATPAQVGVTILAVAVSIAAAYISWRVVEGPLLRWAHGSAPMANAVRRA